MGALKGFCQDFIVLKGQDCLMTHLPELQRFRISLVGKGIGPAFIIEASEHTSTEQEVMDKYAQMAIESNLQEAKCTQTLQSFINRIVIGKEACPYTKKVKLTALGLEKKVPFYDTYSNLRVTYSYYYLVVDIITGMCIQTL